MNSSWHGWFPGTLVLVAAGLACSTSVDVVASGATGMSSAPAAGSGDGSCTSGCAGAGGGTTTVSACDPGALDDDADGDGFDESQGDCNDCDANVNPAAVELIGDGGGGAGGAPAGPPVDEDCNGVIDDLAPPCDDAVALDSEDPMDAARAIDLCQFVKSATWALADGTDPATTLDQTQLAAFHLGHGNLASLGAENTPSKGAKLLALSSGTARNENEPGFVHSFDKKYGSGTPVGFPKETEACPGVVTGSPHDATGVELEITAPSNAKSFSFTFAFFTSEWPEYVCTSFNDLFVANLVPFPQGQTDGNVSFDIGGDPISVNSAFLQVCACPNGPPCGVPPAFPLTSCNCSLGSTGLDGTDFDLDNTTPGWSNASTGWLKTTAPIEVAPGQTFTLRLVAYDSSDGAVDSTTLIDDWQWGASPTSVKTVAAAP